MPNHKPRFRPVRAPARISRRIAIVVGLLAAAMAPGACLTLDSIEGGTCGNAIIDQGEDCDSFDLASGAKLVRCLPPGGPRECRFDCTPVGGVEGDCPDGWVCSPDDYICHAASGTFEDTQVDIPAGAQLLLTGDFDGDGPSLLAIPQDIFGASVGVDQLPGGPGVGRGLPLASHYFDANGQYEETTYLAAPPGAHPSVGDLSADDIDDVAIVDGQGVSVYRGRADRTFAPSIYASQPIPAADIRIWAQEWDGAQLGQEPLAIVQDPMGKPPGVSVVAIDMFADDEPTVLWLGLPPLANLAGEIPTGAVDEDPVSSPCDEFVLAFSGDTHVRVGTPCLGWTKAELNIADLVTGLPSRMPTMVGLPPGVLVAYAKLFDLDGDGHLDLLIGGADGLLYAAYGRGDMTFDSAPNADLQLPPDETASPFWFQALGEEVLAIGHLDADGILDFVTTQAIWLTHPHWVAPDGGGEGAVFGIGGGGGGVVFPGGGAGGAGAGHFEVSPDRVVEFRDSIGSATSAVVGDFNGNGLADVAVSNRDQPNVVFYNGAGGGLFNEFVLPTDGPARSLVVADFDGDVVPDIAVNEGAQASSTTGDSLSIAFGQLGGPPEAPLSMGRLDTIRQISPALLQDPTNHTLDGISEVAIVAQSDGGPLTFTILYGSTDRQLQSPFALVNNGENLTPLRTVIAELSATVDHPDLAVLAASLADNKPWLCLSEAHDDAELDEGSTAFEPLQLPDGMVGDFMTGEVDADGDGVSEIVGFVTLLDPVDYTSHSAMVIAMPEDSGGMRTLVPTVMAGVSDELFLDQPLGGGGVPVAAAAGEGAPIEVPTGTSEQRLVTADVDGDGYLDIVVIGTSTTDWTTHAVIFWNSGSNDPLTAYSMAGRVALPAVPGGYVTAVTSIQVDGDAARELVLLAPNAAYLVDAMPDRTFSEPQAITGVIGGLAVAAADFDGDEIEDLAVANDKITKVYWQKAGNP